MALITFLEYYLKRKTRNSDGSLSMISVSFSRYLRFSSPGRQALDRAVIISFLLDCFTKVFLRSLGYIFGSCEYLLALLSILLGDSLKIVFLPLLLSTR